MSHTGLDRSTHQLPLKLSEHHQQGSKLKSVEWEAAQEEKRKAGWEGLLEVPQSNCGCKQCWITWRENLTFQVLMSFSFHSFQTEGLRLVLIWQLTNPQGSIRCSFTGKGLCSGSQRSWCLCACVSCLSLCVSVSLSAWCGCMHTEERYTLSVLLRPWLWASVLPSLGANHTLLPPFLHMKRV